MIKPPHMIGKSVYDMPFQIITAHWRDGAVSEHSVVGFNFNNPDLLGVSTVWSEDLSIKKWS